MAMGYLVDGSFWDPDFLTDTRCELKHLYMRRTYWLIISLPIAPSSMATERDL